MRVIDIIPISADSNPAIPTVYTLHLTLKKEDTVIKMETVYKIYPDPETAKEELMEKDIVVEPLFVEILPPTIAQNETYYVSEDFHEIQGKVIQIHPCKNNDGILDAIIDVGILAWISFEKGLPITLNSFVNVKGQFFGKIVEIL